MRGASGSRRCSRGLGRWREVVRLDYFKRLLLRGSFKCVPPPFLWPAPPRFYPPQIFLVLPLV